MTTSAAFRVWRSDDAGGHFENFSVDVVPGMVVLDAIHQIQATQAGADEALMLDPLGFVATCNSTHFFIVRNDEVWTSSGKYCLGGITRGLALDTALNSGEEFPLFTDFWIERPEPGAKELVIYALLNSRRMTGAYRFQLRPGVTGPWQVSERHQTGFAERARFDAAYDRDVSLRTDLRLLVDTVRVVARGTGC